VKLKDLRGKSQSRSITDARALAAYLLREDAGCSYPEIGRFLNKDHSSIVKAHARVAKAIEENSEWRARVESVRAAIATSIEQRRAERGKELALLLAIPINRPLRRNSFMAHMILKEAARKFDLSIEDLAGESREALTVKARHLAMFLLYTKLSWPSPKIGDLFGEWHKTTVTYACAKIAWELQVDTNLQDTVKRIWLRCSQTPEPVQPINTA
jgi:chromosomal replication initiation ATPase DnaA